MAQRPLSLDEASTLERTPDKERRVSVRFLSSLESPCQTISPRGETCQARIHDVSAFGIGLVMPREVEASTRLIVDLGSVTASPVRSMLTRVVHGTALDGGEWLAGCAFIGELSDADLRRFQAERVQPPEMDGRAWVRFPCNVETVCSSLDTMPGEQLPVRILNISAGGLGLLLPCEFDSRTVLNLALPGKPPRKVLIRVVQARHFARGEWFLGCEFADQLSNDELQALR